MIIHNASQSPAPRESEPSLDPTTVAILVAQHNPSYLRSTPGYGREEEPLLAQFREAAAFNVSYPNNSRYETRELNLSRCILTATRWENQARLADFAGEHYRQGQIQSLIKFCDGLSTTLRRLRRHVEESQPPQQRNADLDECIEFQLFITLIYPKVLALQKWMDVPSFPTSHN